MAVLATALTTTALAAGVATQPASAATPADAADRALITTAFLIAFDRTTPAQQASVCTMWHSYPATVYGITDTRFRQQGYSTYDIHRAVRPALNRVC